MFENKIPFGLTYSNDFQTGSLSKIGSLKELKRSLTKTQWKPHYSFNSELSSCLNEYLIKMQLFSWETKTILSL